VIGDAKPVTPKRELGAILNEAKALAKSMSAKNWQQKKASLLALLSGIILLTKLRGLGETYG
jgi:hypothetical protein